MPDFSRIKARTPRYSWLAFLCGSVSALILAELLLHNISGRYENQSGIEVRWMREGMARSHFSLDGLRLTGNPQIAGAPNVLILGDSHIEALSVPDEQTAGSVLERQLRSEGRAWNVLQYGYGGADGPDYIYAAPLLLERYQPARIFLIANVSDFERTTSSYVRLEERSGKVLAEPLRPDVVRGRPVAFGGERARRLKESGLLYAATIRFTLDLRPRLTEHQTSELEADAGAAASKFSEESLDFIVRGLRQVYGDRLSILYLPEQPYSREEVAEPAEAALAVQCKIQGLECRSLRQRMVDALLQRHELARGFMNTAPGFRHINAAGHQIIADEILDWLNASH